MAEVIQGTVGVVMDSQFKKGEFRVKLEEHDDWFGASKRFEGTIEQGNVVKLKVERKGKSAHIVGVKLVEKVDAEAAPARKSGNSKDEYWEAKDKYDKEVVQPRIVYVNARDHAIRVVQMLLAADAIALPAAKKHVERKDVILGEIDLLTARYFADASDVAAIQRAAEELDTDPSAPEDTELDGEDGDGDEGE